MDGLSTAELEVKERDLPSRDKIPMPSYSAFATALFVVRRSPAEEVCVALGGCTPQKCYLAYIAGIAETYRGMIIVGAV